MVTAPTRILTVRAPAELAERIAAKAREEERSQNTVIVRALREAVSEKRPEAAA